MRVYIFLKILKRFDKEIDVFENIPFAIYRYDKFFNYELTLILNKFKMNMLLQSTLCAKKYIEQHRFKLDEIKRS